MQESPIELPEPQPQGRSRFNFALFVSAAALVIVLAGFYFWSGRQSPPDAAHDAIFSFGPAEQAYATKIQIENLALSRAENFLHQEITTLSGELVNGDDRALRAVELTTEFYDDLNQVVLRERRPAVNPPSPPLAAGERRSFDVGFEHIPSSWNSRLPVVRISGLQFTPAIK
jgi:hypothetical protein